jgi:hypothetical protein
MTKIVHRILTIAVVIPLALMPMSAFAFGPSADSGQKSDDQKKNKKEEKEKEKTAKHEREYTKIKEYSKNEYENDPVFRSAVEEAYRQKQREHSEYAYFMNTHDAKDVRVMNNGDKLKVDDTLYDNPLVQDYVNRVGHSLVPVASGHLYAFKVTLNPIPEARSLSTGTVYVSSGLISIVDNEAQLAYVLGHEIAHVEKGHWHDDVLIEHGMHKYNEKQEQKRNLITGIGTVVTGPMARMVGGSAMDALTASIFVENGLPTLLKMAIPNAVFTWDKGQEDEADQLALTYMLNRKYDPREVPKFYANLQRTSQRDSRASLGFMADSTRMLERVQQVDAQLGGLGKTMLSTGELHIGASELGSALQAKRSRDDLAASSGPAVGNQPDQGKQLDALSGADRGLATVQKEISGKLAANIDALLDAGEIIGTTGEFQSVMAELKRDNGVRAFYYDMFRTARDNLEESLSIRNNDPEAHFYYAKVLKLTARTLAEKRQALEEFVTAINLDKRQVLPEARLHRALATIDSKDQSQKDQILADLKEYVALYQREHGGSLPPNMDVLYDYMQDAGDMMWRASPATNVATKNIDPISTAAGSAARATQVDAPLVPAQPKTTPVRRKP